MFENLTDRLSKTLKNLRGQGRLSEDNIRDSLREVRMALLEADVALPVVKDFIDNVREKALGQEVVGSLSPGQALVKVVNDELVAIMGESQATIDLNHKPPVIVLMAGLQGAGKTTTVAKLARRLRESDKKSVMVASADVYRPAAIDQLQTLSTEVGAEFYPSNKDQKPVSIARDAVEAARKAGVDVLIIDTAGRLAIDQQMMDEIRAIHDAVDPVETLFVVDSMTGQDAARTAKAFDDALPLSGVVLTKIDGDARGGAALSVRHITGKPIKFIGSGEKTDALEAFHPDRIASRILGMGDILSLVEQAQDKVDHEKGQATRHGCRRIAGDAKSRPHQANETHGRDYRLHDAAGTAQTRSHQRFAQASRRAGFRYPDTGRQPIAETTQANAAHDEENGQ
jgi:signal recognition particle subunit SRP54